MSRVAVAGAATATGDAGGVLVRDVAWEDIAALVAIDAENFTDDAWSAATWWAELAERPRREYVVITDGADTILGYGGVDHGGELADIMTVAVAPQARGRGLGRLVLVELERRARARGARHLLLEVRADNEPAVGLYVSHGWSQLSVRRRYYQPGDVDALILRKSFSDREEP